MDGLRKDSMERVDRWIDGEHMIWKGLIDGQKGQMDRKDGWLDGEYIVWKGLIDGQKGQMVGWRIYSMERIDRWIERIWN